MTKDDPAALQRLRALRDAVRTTGAAARPELAAYVEKVRRWAYKVTDEDVAALLAAGVTQEEVYEATMDTAFSAGIERFEIALRVLDEAT